MSHCELAWEYMKQAECFTTSDVANAVEMELELCRTIIKRLERQGFVAVERGRGVQGNPLVYKVIAQNDSAPVFGKGRNRGHAKNRNGTTGRQLVWNSLRINRTTTAAIIESVTGCSPKSIKSYLAELEKAGYIRGRRVSKHLSPKERAGTETCWHLIRDTGPKAPIGRRSSEACWDQNEQKLYPYLQKGSDS